MAKYHEMKKNYAESMNYLDQVRIVKATTLLKGIVDYCQVRLV